MTATQVVPTFQIFKNRVSGLVVGLKPAAGKQFTFKCGEKTFAHGVIKVVANTTHRPADNAPAEHIQHHRQIQETLAGRHVGGIGHPQQVAARRR